MLERFNLEIGGGLGALAGKVWRIGLMGFASNPKNVTLCLSALETGISELGGNVEKGAALAAAAITQLRRSAYWPPHRPPRRAEESKCAIVWYKNLTVLIEISFGYM